MQIAGVDFSGAKTDNHTWLASGDLDRGVLTLLDCRPVSRQALLECLLALPGDSVAALDFPFSVPESFVGFWVPGATGMPDLWAAASAMDLAAFIALRDEFVGNFGEPKRLCDTHFPECYSCLHKANPNMVPMTFYGMKMLATLWRAGCAIPPLETPALNTKKTATGKALLLEAMPGAALKAMKLPYKGYKNGSKAVTLRRVILEGLQDRSGIVISNLSGFEETCLNSHDALDSVVALLVAALWVKDETLFWRPSLEPSQDSSAKFSGQANIGSPERISLLEGWLYAPVFL